MGWFVFDKQEVGNYNQGYKQLDAVFQLLNWLTDFKLWCLLRCVIYVPNSGKFKIFSWDTLMRYELVLTAINLQGKD